MLRCGTRRETVKNHVGRPPMRVNIREGYKACAPKPKGQKSSAQGFNPGYPPRKNAP